MASRAKTPTWPAGASLLDFYNQVFRPSARWHVSDFRLRVYDQAVHRLCAHCGGPSPTLGEVTAELVDELLAAQLESCNPKWRRDVRNCLGRIVRAWEPAAQWRDPVPPTEPGTLREHFERCYVPERLTGAKPQTICEFRIALKKLNEHVGRDLRLDELRDSIFAEFFQELLAFGRTAVTCNKYRAMLFAIWRNALDRGLVALGPRVKKIKEPRNIPRAWTRDEMQRIFATAATFRPKRHYGQVPVNHWWVAVLNVAYETALRRGSLLAIRLADVDLKAGTLYARGETMKNKRGQDYQLGRGAIEAVRRIFRPEREFVFRCDLLVMQTTFSNRISRDFACLLQAAGVASGGRSSLHLFHQIRRTSATHIAAAAGVAAAGAHLGHGGEYVTERYIDATQLPRRDVTAILAHLSTTGRQAS